MTESSPSNLETGNDIAFSVIVPVYNAARYLDTALNSVLQQDFPSWECICVDDGSKDESPAILDAYAAKDPRFVVVHKPNGGVSSARNQALDIARGKWIVYLDGDDQLAPGMFSYLSREIQDLDFMKLQIQSLKDGDEILPAPESAEVRRFDFSDHGQLNEAFRILFGTMHAWNVCYRREAVADVRFLNVPNDEDGHYGGECFMNSERGGITTARLYCYFQRPNTASTVYKPRYLHSCMTVLEERAKLLRKWKHSAEVKQLLVRKLDAFGLGLIFVVERLPRADRVQARREFMEFLGRYDLRYEYSTSWQNFKYRIVTSSYAAVWLFKWLPVSCKALLCRIRDRILRRC